MKQITTSRTNAGLFDRIVLWLFAFSFRLVEDTVPTTTDTCQMRGTIALIPIRMLRYKIWGNELWWLIIMILGALAVSAAAGALLLLDGGIFVKIIAILLVAVLYALFVIGAIWWFPFSFLQSRFGDYYIVGKVTIWYAIPISAMVLATLLLANLSMPDYSTAQTSIMVSYMFGVLTVIGVYAIPVLFVIIGIFAAIAWIGYTSKILVFDNRLSRLLIKSAKEHFCTPVVITD